VFFASKIQLLGHIVSGTGIEMDPAKVEKAINIDSKNVKQLQQFLGLCNYYRRFVPEFSKTAASLYAFFKKDIEFQLNTWIHGMMRPFFTIRNMENIQLESVRMRPKESIKLLKSLLYQMGSYGTQKMKIGRLCRNRKYRNYRKGSSFRAFWKRNNSRGLNKNIIGLEWMHL